jgi:hypothetical protein
MTKDDDGFQDVLPVPLRVVSNWSLGETSGVKRKANGRHDVQPIVAMIDCFFISIPLGKAVVNQPHFRIFFAPIWLFRLELNCIAERTLLALFFAVHIVAASIKGRA